MALLITVNEKVKEVFPENGKYFTLEELYDLLNCRVIDILPLADGRLMVIDDEGKLQSDWQVNLTATELFRNGRMNTSRMHEFIKTIREQGWTVIDARSDTMDCIAGDVLVGNDQEIR